jgi:hypothetical protein
MLKNQIERTKHSAILAGRTSRVTVRMRCRTQTEAPVAENIRALLESRPVANRNMRQLGAVWLASRGPSLLGRRSSDARQLSKVREEDP